MAAREKTVTVYQSVNHNPSFPEGFCWVSTPSIPGHGFIGRGVFRLTIHTLIDAKRSGFTIRFLEETDAEHGRTPLSVEIRRQIEQVLTEEDS